MSKYTLGIDYGTLSGRAALVNVADGAIVATAEYVYPHAIMGDCLPSGRRLEADWALQHPRDYLEVLDHVVPEVMKGINPADVLGLGVDFTACTVLPTDEKGYPLCFQPKYEDEPHAYVKLWKHHAAQPQADRIEKLAKEMDMPFLRYFGGKLSCEWMFPKILSTLEEAPEVYHDAAYFIEAGDWITWLLTGHQVRSYSLAAVKAYYIKGIGYPDKAFFKALNPEFENVVEDKMNAPVQSQGTAMGTLTPEWAARLGLSEKTIVSVAVPDAHGGVVASGLKDPGVMLSVMGTSACHMLLDHEIRFVPGAAGCLDSSMIPGLVGFECNQFQGDHYAWFVENCCPASYKEEADKRGINLHQLLTEKAQQLKVGESGLVAIDWWNGNRSILVDGQLSGFLMGMTLQTKPEEIYRAIIEATAFTTRVIVENFRANGVAVNRMAATGGISRKNPFVMQLFCDVTGLSLDVCGAKEGGAQGSAILAAGCVGSENGGYDCLNDAMNAMCPAPIASYTPNMENKKAYDAIYEEFVRLHDYFGRGGNDVMKRLKKIRRDVLEQKTEA